MPKTAESGVPAPQNSLTGLTQFPSLVRWEDPWEESLDLSRLRRNAAKFETIRQLSDHPRHGDPLPTIDRARFVDLVKPLELDVLRSAVLTDDARLIAAWYELPRHQARVYMGQKALLDALDEAANPVRNLHDWLAPFEYETANLLQELPSSVVGAQREFDIIGLSKQAAEFSALVDRMLRYLRPAKRKKDSRRNIAIALTVWAVECATAEAVKTTRGTLTNPHWHFTNQSGIFVRDLMNLLGWPDERILVGTVEKLKRPLRVSEKSSFSDG